jgi:hypothetical protein
VEEIKLNHALVVGGTGMLAGVSLWLTENGCHLSVIARNPHKMNTLISKSPSSSITPLFVDYTNENKLRTEIQRTIRQYGPIQLAVAWIHSTGKNALDIIAEEISKTGGQNWKLFHVVGSSTNLEAAINSVKIPRGCLYRQVQLGFVIENGTSRWLTHDEISNGVIAAIRHDKPLSIVGTVEPWDQRP